MTALAQADLAALAQRALAELQGALAKPPLAVSAEVDSVERLLVRLRDGLINRARHASAGSARSTLNTVNVCLSLVAGIEYPATGVRRELLEQTCEQLRQLVAADQF